MTTTKSRRDILLPLARRAWQAYLALPLVEGQHPEYRVVERSVGLSNGTLGPIFRAEKGLGGRVLEIAKALKVDPWWLTDGVGKSPKPHAPLDPCPADVPPKSGRFAVLNDRLEAVISRQNPPYPPGIVAMARAFVLSDSHERTEEDWKRILDGLAGVVEAPPVSSRGKR